MLEITNYPSSSRLDTEAWNCSTLSQPFSLSNLDLIAGLGWRQFSMENVLQSLLWTLLEPIKRKEKLQLSLTPPSSLTPSQRGFVKNLKQFLSSGLRLRPGPDRGGGEEREDRHEGGPGLRRPQPRRPQRACPVEESRRPSRHTPARWRSQLPGKQQRRCIFSTETGDYRGMQQLHYFDEMYCNQLGCQTFLPAMEGQFRAEAVGSLVGLHENMIAEQGSKWWRYSQSVLYQESLLTFLSCHAPSSFFARLTAHI